MITAQEKQVALKFQVKDLWTNLHVNHPTVCVGCAIADSIKNTGAYGHRDNKQQQQRRCVKIKRERSKGSDVYNRTRLSIHHFLEPTPQCCITLQRINHSYPVSSCIYQQRPGCSGSLAQEDDQRQRSKQYPVKAAGGGRRFWGEAEQPYTGLLCLGAGCSLLHLL